MMFVFNLFVILTEFFFLLYDFNLYLYNSLLMWFYFLYLNFSHILALQHLEDETRKAEEAHQADLRTLNSLIEKTKSAVIKRSALQR